MVKATQFNGFTPLLVNYSSKVQHCLYIRAHQTSSQGSQTTNLPPGRTLFVVNLPPDATSREVTQLFKPCGTVERILFSSGAEADAEPEDEVMEEEPVSSSDDDIPSTKKKRRKAKAKPTGPPKITPLPSPALRTYRHSGHTAHIIFLDTSSLDRALTLVSPQPWPTSTEPSGIAHYLALHASLRPPLETVKEHADTSLEAYEYLRTHTKIALAAGSSKYKKGEAIVDEDGFTLVTRAGTHGNTLGGGVGVASKKFEMDMAKGGNGDSALEARKKKQEKDGFYTFQVREKKRKGAHFLQFERSCSLDTFPNKLSWTFAKISRKTRQRSRNSNNNASSNRISTCITSICMYHRCAIISRVISVSVRPLRT